MIFHDILFQKNDKKIFFLQRKILMDANLHERKLLIHDKSQNMLQNIHINVK